MSQRIVETDDGLQGEVLAAQYEAMMRRARDQGNLYTGKIIKSGITEGLVLEIGTGPGYLGLEWLKQTQDTRLIGVDLSPAMISAAENNARTYGFGVERAEYRVADVHSLPFEDGVFDAVISNAALHEWRDPLTAFAEIYRVLAPGARGLICDLRRDMAWLVKQFMRLQTPKELRSGLIATLNAAYTEEEIKCMLAATPFRKARISSNPFSFFIEAKKSLV